MTNLPKWLLPPPTHKSISESLCLLFIMSGIASINTSLWSSSCFSFVCGQTSKLLSSNFKFQTLNSSLFHQTRSQKTSPYTPLLLYVSHISYIHSSEILVALPSKYIQNLNTSHHLCDDKANLIHYLSSPILL